MILDFSFSREQRVTHILIFITIGLSVTMVKVLSLIPMPVLYGVFLYMGVASLNGLQFFDRILLVFMPKKYQPDLPYLRRVPIMRVHLFTFIQFMCLVGLWVIKDIKATSILFPIMVILLWKVEDPFNGGKFIAVGCDDGCSEVTRSRIQ